MSISVALSESHAAKAKCTIRRYTAFVILIMRTNVHIRAISYIGYASENTVGGVREKTRVWINIIPRGIPRRLERVETGVAVSEVEELSCPIDMFHKPWVERYI